MRTLLSWVLSFSLHLGALLILFSAAEDRMQLHPILTLDLIPQKTIPLVVKKPEVLPHAPAMSPSGQHKGKIGKKFQLGQGPVKKQPVSVAQEKLISASTRPFLGDESSDGVRHIRMDAVAHRGAEARFGRMLLADYYSYSSTEFAGQFTVDKDRVVTIIDARDTPYGRFLLYDSQLGALRRLKKFNKYIYTIGPSLDKDEPVTGSVTFLAKNDRIERFIYLPDGEKGLFPAKVHFREEPLRIKSGPEDLEAIITLPPAKGAYPAMVLLHGKECLPPALVQGAVRALGMHGVALMAFSPHGCKEEGIPFFIAKDASLALTQLKKHKEMQGQPVGLMGIGAGSVDALQSAFVAGDSADCLICLPGKEGGHDMAFNLSVIAQLTIPSLWIVPSSPQWKTFRVALEQLRDQEGKPLTIVVEEAKKAEASITDAKHSGGAVALMQAVLDNHAQLISSWLNEVKRTLITE